MHPTKFAENGKKTGNIVKEIIRTTGWIMDIRVVGHFEGILLLADYVPIMRDNENAPKALAR
jgi:hypothetical protein